MTNPDTGTVRRKAAALTTATAASELPQGDVLFSNRFRPT
jgi:hypothetical protein